MLKLMMQALFCVSVLQNVATKPNPLQAISPLCDRALFGAPKAEDCYQAMFWIPYINRPGRDSQDAKAFRIFAEPQFLGPPFSFLGNAYAPHAIVQLPKIWKHGSCQIALVLQPYIRTYGRPPQLSPAFTERWSDVVNHVLRLRPCVESRRGPTSIPQGGYTTLTIADSQPAGLYMYATDSRFMSEMMTPYMMRGEVITPPSTPRLMGNETSLGWSLNRFNSTSENLSTPALDVLSIS